MGMDRTVAIGPYIWFETQSEDVKIDVFGCKPCESIYFSNGGNVYCQKCGKESTTYAIERKSRIGYYEMGIESDRVFEMEYGDRTVWFPNEFIEGLNDVSISRYDEDNEDPSYRIPDEPFRFTPDEDIRIFTIAHQDVIDVLESKGIKYKVEWGILDYWI